MPPLTQPTTTTVVATSHHTPGRSVNSTPSNISLTSAAAAAAAADAVLAAHERLPPTGKPPRGQWTPLAGFAVVVEGERSTTEPSTTQSPFAATCVALGTGSKCVGASRRSSHGDIVNDGHAEVVARRALVRWLVAELERAGEKRDQRIPLFERHAGALRDAPFLPVHFTRCPGWALHMVTTAPPCGDAAIVEGGGVTGARALVARGRDDDNNDTAGTAVVGTAAPHTLIDVAAQAAGHHNSLGAPRRKPGRGPTTLSMSCSDKMARWVCVGVQGALVGRVLAEPLYVNAVTMVVEEEGGGLGAKKDTFGRTPTLAISTCKVSTPPDPAARLAAIARALVHRLDGACLYLPIPFAHTPPVLHVAVASGSLAAAAVAPPPGSTAQTAPTSTSWARMLQAGGGGNWEPPDVVVGATGRKAGAVKRKVVGESADTTAAPRALWPTVCKRAAFERWCALVQALGGTPPNNTYGAAKRGAQAFQTASAAVRRALGGWIAKPEEEWGL